MKPPERDRPGVGPPETPGAGSALRAGGGAVPASGGAAGMWCRLVPPSLSPSVPLLPSLCPSIPLCRPDHPWWRWGGDSQWDSAGAVAPGGPARDLVHLVSPGVTLPGPAVTWCHPASPSPSLVSLRVPQRHPVPPPASSPVPGVTSCHPLCPSECHPACHLLLLVTSCRHRCHLLPPASPRVCPCCPQHRPRVTLPVFCPCP